MGDTLEIFGKEFTNVAGFKAKDENGNTLIYTRGGSGGGTPAISIVDTTDSHGGTVREITALNISDTTAEAGDVAQGKYFYTAQGVKTVGTALGGSSGQVVTGTVTGNGTHYLSLPCDFAPDLIYVYGDLSGDATLRGVIAITMIKDLIIYLTLDGSTGSANGTTVLLEGITNYNESDTVSTHGTYADGVFLLDTVSNSSSYYFVNGVSYYYMLAKWT